MENKEFNLYDLSAAGSDYYKKQTKLQENAAETLRYLTEKNIKEVKGAEEKKLNEQMAAARFGNAAPIAKNKARVQSLQEEINYNENASVIGMTEMIANVVEKGLLLDESEFAQICPNYKNEIREIVSGYLKESQINENITNKDTLILMEHVYRTLPSTKEGKNLSEDAIQTMVAAKKSLNVDESINRLSGNVGKKVASLMEKEQKRVDQINQDIEKAEIPQEAPAEEEPITSEEILVALQNGETTPEEIDAMYEQGQIPEDVYAEVAQALDSAAEQKETPTEGEEVAVPGVKKQIQMTPDGTLSINIYENAQPKAVEGPEAKMQIQMDPEGNLAVADANKQITVGADGSLSVDICEAISYAVSNYVEYEDLQESLTTDFDITKWSPEMEIERKYTQKGRIFGTIIGWFFGGVIGAFLKVLFPAGGLLAQKVGTALAAAIKGAKASTEAAIDTVEKASSGAITGATVAGAAIGAAAGHYIGRKINARINRKKIKALIGLCSKDEKCQSLINEMRDAIESEDRDKLKLLREQFALRLDELKNKVSINDIEEPQVKKYTSVYTENLVRETPRSGLIESLAVNEAKQLLREGKPYDADYCLAKAIMYVTITEAMNEMGLMNIDDRAYNQIISAAGGAIIKEKDECSTSVKIVKKKKEEYQPENFNNSTVVNDNASILEKWKQGNKNLKLALQEGILVNQFNDPVYNTGGYDMADKIRKRRLMKEQAESQIINE